MDEMDLAGYDQPTPTQTKVSKTGTKTGTRGDAQLKAGGTLSSDFIERELRPGGGATGKSRVGRLRIHEHGQLR